MALKVITPQYGNAPEWIVRFRREAQAAARLSGHVGIVGAHDAGEYDGGLWFAMDLVEGRSLQEWIDAGDLVPPGLYVYFISSGSDAKDSERTGTIAVAY